jgi:hypothetical protein
LHRDHSPWDRSLGDEWFGGRGPDVDLPLHRIARGWWQNGCVREGGKREAELPVGTKREGGRTERERERA